MIYSPPIQDDVNSSDLQYPELRNPYSTGPNAPGRVLYDNDGNPIAVTNSMKDPLPYDNPAMDGELPLHPIDYGPYPTVDLTPMPLPIYTMQPSPISSPTSGQTPLPNGSVTPTSTVVATPDIVTELKTFVHANPMVALAVAGIAAYLVLGKK